MDYFGAIDQGTTSTRFIVYDEEHKQVTQCIIIHYRNNPLPTYAIYHLLVTSGSDVFYQFF